MSATDSGITIPHGRTQAVQQQPIPPEQPISVRLSAQQWQQVLVLLHEVSAPARVTSPLIGEIHAQCLAANSADLRELETS